jgi:selenoprotein W-related protein
LAEFQRDISELALVPSGGGAFEVMVGESLVYSKKETGRHAEPDEILEGVRKVLT